MLTALIRRQVRLFIIITVVAVSLMAVYYVQVPAQLGIGRYPVSVELSRGGGLYPKSLVTYRGYEIGQIERVELKPGGAVVAHLEIDNDAHVPADVIAQVQSASVIGEQYINFLPPSGRASNRFLQDGSVVPASQTQLPTTTQDLITSVHSFLKSVPTADLNTTIDELGRAFGGQAGESLGSVIDHGSHFATQAENNLKPTTDLINNLQPVLRTQTELDPQIRKLSKSMDTVTKQLAASDTDLRHVIVAGSPFLKQAARSTRALQTQVPGFLSEFAAGAEVFRVFLPGLEHILIVGPALVPMIASGIPPEAKKKRPIEGNMYFKMTFPTACTKGFPEAGKMRDPYDLTLAKLPQDSYCKVPRDSSLVVRGARNNPCPQDQQRRSAYAAGCGLVFDPVQVERSGVAQNEKGTALVDPQMARLLAPNGPFFLLDANAEHNPRTLRALLERTVAR